MLFGFGISDFAILASLVQQVIILVRDGPAEVQCFQGNLSIVQLLVTNFQSHATTFMARAGQLPAEQGAVIETVFAKAADGLRNLEAQLGQRAHQRRFRALASIAVLGESLWDLRDRLEVHMGAMSLIYHSLNAAQLFELAADVELRRTASQQQQRRQTLAISRSRFQQIHDLNSQFFGTHGGSMTTSDSFDSRDFLVRRWRDQLTISNSAGDQEERLPESIDGLTFNENTRMSTTTISSVPLPPAASFVTEERQPVDPGRRKLSQLTYRFAIGSAIYWV